jgi:phospholipase C
MTSSLLAWPRIAGCIAVGALSLPLGCTGDDGDSGGGGACAVPIDETASERQACAFDAGAKVSTTLGLTDSQRVAIPIKHIVVLMKENRSYDHILGALHDQGQPEAEQVPASFSNLDAAGAVVAPFHLDTTCVPKDPGHQWEAMHAQVDAGKMDGFVTSAASTTGTDGHFAMGYYDESDLPFDYFLARTYALNDRHFASVRSGTFPNRNFLLLGTADGVTATGTDFPDPSTPTIFDALDAAHVTWGVYSDGALLSGTLGWTSDHVGAHSFATFLAGLDSGDLPAVTFVDGIEDVEDEHPASSLQAGEAWTRRIYEHAVASPLWPSLAMVWTYDEAGGFADHVPPPEHACIARPGAKDAAFFELGARIPLVVISPWARASSVVHTVEDHTAITRFIEAVFDLPALTARDANSTALLEMFDFACGPALLHPPEAPAAGIGGCGAGIAVTSDKPTYASGEAIHVSFTGAPGTDPLDWIAVYAYGPDGPSSPHPGSLVWDYVGGTHAATTAPPMGAVTLDANSVNAAGDWPLPAGQYTAYYLFDDGYTAAASVDFTVQ